MMGDSGENVLSSSTTTTPSLYALPKLKPAIQKSVNESIFEDLLVKKLQEENQRTLRKKVNERVYEDSIIKKVQAEKSKQASPTTAVLSKTSIPKNQHTIRKTVDGNIFDDSIVKKIQEEQPKNAPPYIPLEPNTIISEFIYNRKISLVTLNSKEISWLDAQQSQCVIPLSKIISCDIAISTVSTMSGIIKLDRSMSFLGDHSEDDAKKQVDGFPGMDRAPEIKFTVHSVHERDDCVWEMVRHSFECANSPVCLSWVTALRAALSSENRPKNLLVLVNPFGGWKNAQKVYMEIAAPIFKRARIHTTVIVTEHANHASDIIKTYADFGDLDGVVAVGGDGFFQSIMNTVLTYRPDRSPRIRFGFVPGGSTNTVVFSTMGTDDATTASLHIVLGSRSPLDIAMVMRKGGDTRLACSMVTYGFFSDVVAHGEKHRWMGPVRYDWSGFRTFMRRPIYKGTLHVKKAGKVRGDGGICLRDCQLCLANSPPRSDIPKKPLTEVGYQPPSDFPVEEGWKTISGEFMCINAAIISCKCGKSPNGMAPHAHLADGCMDLIIVHSCRRDQYLVHLSCLANQAADHLNFDFVEVIKAKEFWFTPDNNTNCKSQWTADGEPLTGTSSVGVRLVTNQVHLFASGPPRPPKVMPKLA